MEKGLPSVSGRLALPVSVAGLGCTENKEEKSANTPVHCQVLLVWTHSYIYMMNTYIYNVLLVMHFDLYACVCLRAVDQTSTSDFRLHMPESLVIEDQLLIREITSLPILLLYV